MIPPSPCDPKSRHSSTRSKSRIHLISAPPGQMEVTDTASAKASFGQDFLLEHCLSGHPVKSVRAAGKSLNPLEDMQESPQAFGFPC